MYFGQNMPISGKKFPLLLSLPSHRHNFNYDYLITIKRNKITANSDLKYQLFIAIVFVDYERI